MLSWRDAGTLIAKVGEGCGGYDPKGIAAAGARVLSEREVWFLAEQWVVRPPKPYRPVTVETDGGWVRFGDGCIDGEIWIVERRWRDEYVVRHWADCTDPTEVTILGTAMLALAGGDIGAMPGDPRSPWR